MYWPALRRSGPHAHPGSLARVPAVPAPPLAFGPRLTACPFRPPRQRGSAGAAATPLAVEERAYVVWRAAAPQAHGRCSPRLPLPFGQPPGGEQKAT